LASVQNIHVRYQTLKAGSMKMITVFWVAVPCSLVEIGRRFGGAYYHHHRGDLSWIFEKYRAPWSELSMKVTRKALH
jgi:hypothetical protein